MVEAAHRLQVRRPPFKVKASKAANGSAWVHVHPTAGGGMNARIVPARHLQRAKGIFGRLTTPSSGAEGGGLMSYGSDIVDEKARRAKAFGFVLQPMEPAAVS
jgi:hypothetical protein